MEVLVPKATSLLQQADLAEAHDTGFKIFPGHMKICSDNCPVCRHGRDFATKKGPGNKAFSLSREGWVGGSYLLTPGSPSGGGKRA